MYLSALNVIWLVLSIT